MIKILQLHQRNWIIYGIEVKEKISADLDGRTMLVIKQTISAIYLYKNELYIFQMMTIWKIKISNQLIIFKL